MIDRTVPQIKSNPRLYDLFLNTHLDQLDRAQATDLVHALIEQPPQQWTQEQNEFLERARVSFNRQMAMVEFAREKITGPEITRMAGRDPRIQEIIGQTRDLPQAVRVLHSQLDHLALSDPRAFGELMRNIQAAENLRTGAAARENDERVRNTLGKYGITEEQYEAAVGLGRTEDMTGRRISDETRARLRQLARDQMGAFAATANFFSFGLLKVARAKNIATDYARERALMRRRDAYMQEVGVTLRGTLDPDMRIAIQEAIRTGRDPEVVLNERDDRNVKTIDDYQRVRTEARGEYADDAIKGRFSQKLEAYALQVGAAPEDFTPAQEQAFNTEFMASERQRQSQHKGRGLLQALLALLFPTDAQMTTKTNNWWSTLRTPPAAPAPATP